MSMPEKVKKFLKKHKVNYTVQTHAPSFSSAETAQFGHIPGKKLAKAVIVKADGKYLMVVVPASRIVELFKLNALVNAKNLELAEEAELKDLFPGCEPGAIPPLGKLYGISCYFDDRLNEEDEIVFNAGSHTETITLFTEDLLRVSPAVIGDFSVQASKAAA